MLKSLTDSIATLTSGVVPNFLKQTSQAPVAGKESAVEGRCAIPLPPIRPLMRTVEGVWQEYMQETPGPDGMRWPSIRRLINDHGIDWQHSSYRYNRQLWYKKRKVIVAIEGLRNSLNMSAANAVELLENHRNSLHIGLHAFCTEKARGLPSLSVDCAVDISGKVKDGSTWRQLRVNDTGYTAYRQYLVQLKSFLNITVEMR